MIGKSKLEEWAGFALNPAFEKGKQRFWEIQVKAEVSRQNLSLSELGPMTKKVMKK